METIPALLKPIFEYAEKFYPDNPCPMALSILQEKYSALQQSKQSKHNFIDTVYSTALYSGQGLSNLEVLPGRGFGRNEDTGYGGESNLVRTFLH